MAYEPVFSSLAVVFFMSLPRRKQRALLERAAELSRDPFVLPDYVTHDSDGREIAHLVADGFVLTYWVDHAGKQVMVVEIDLAD